MTLYKFIDLIMLVGTTTLLAGFSRPLTVQASGASPGGVVVAAAVPVDHPEVRGEEHELLPRSFHRLCLALEVAGYGVLTLLAYLAFQHCRRKVKPGVEEGGHNEQECRFHFFAYLLLAFAAVGHFAISILIVTS